MFDLTIQNLQQAFEIPVDKLMHEWAKAALLNDRETQISLQIVEAEEIQQLNKDYRDKDKATNVLSFPMELPQELINEMDVHVLGDLVICAEVVAEESKQQKKTIEEHWAHMIVHGMLHLQGYDHIDDAEAEQMEALEIKILNQLGFDNPYQLVTK